ncbi:MAG TPA: hypothetical protein VFZ83_15410 [Acidimicrobiia bacterium]|nr:hypothetical protein [Acidimicrobiia bacterium]
MRYPRRSVLFAGVTTCAVVALATPAGAHGAESVPATNQEPRVRSVTPEISGLDVRIVDVGEHVEVRNHTANEVTVLGYDAEPYLRVGPDGVFRNRRSPATFWNEQDIRSETPPAGFDASATPDWERIGSGRVVRWHDHRAHWMGSEPDDGEQILSTWEITLVAGGREIVVRGDIVQRDAPSPVGPLALGAGVAIAMAVASRTRWWPIVLLAGLIALTGSALLDVVGRWGATTRSGPTKLFEGIYTLAGGALAAWALVRLARSARRGDPDDTTPMVLLAAVVVTLALALGQLPWLGRALLPTDVPADLARALAGLVVGVGVGTVVAAALHLRRTGDVAAVTTAAPEDHPA